MIRHMVHRLTSITLTLILIALSIHLAKRSIELHRLQAQVAELNNQFGSLDRVAPGKFWIKLIEHRPDNFGWRIHMPPVKEICHWESSIDPHGLSRYYLLDTIDVAEFQLEAEIQFFMRAGLRDGHRYRIIFFGSHKTWGGGGAEVPFIPIDFYDYKDLPHEAFVFELNGETQQTFDMDSPIPIYSTRISAAAIQTMLDSKRIDKVTAERLAAPRTFYIGTAQAYRQMTGSVK